MEALDYLKHLMYVKCSMKTLKGNGTWIRNSAMTLWRYCNKIIHVSASKLKCLAKLDGRTVDTAVLKVARRKYAEAVQMTHPRKIISNK